MWCDLTSGRWRYAVWTSSAAVCYSPLGCSLQWKKSCSVCHDQTGQSWFWAFHQQPADVSTGHSINKKLFLLSFLCSFLLGSWVQFPLYFPPCPAWVSHHVFLSPITSCSLHFRFEHSAHTLISSDCRTCAAHTHTGPDMQLVDWLLELFHFKLAPRAKWHDTKVITVQSSTHVLKSNLMW